MKKFSKLFAVVALALGLAAAAQAQSYSLTNVGALHNTTSAVADVVGGPGTSFSVGKSEGMVSANGNISLTPGAQGLSGANGNIVGDVTTKGSGSVFNVSTGTGTGSAKSDSWQDGAVYGNLSFNAPGQALSLSGSADGGSIRNNPNGSDVHLGATTNQDAYGTAGTHTQFNVSGYVGSGPIANGAQVVGYLNDTKLSEAFAESGRIVFTGTQPTGMNMGTAVVHAASSAEVSGAFSDPAHN